MESNQLIEELQELGWIVFYYVKGKCNNEEYQKIRQRFRFDTLLHNAIQLYLLGNCNSAYL